MPKRIQWVLSEPLYAKGSKLSIDGASVWFYQPRKVIP